MRGPIFQDSEGTITSAEFNYEIFLPVLDFTSDNLTNISIEPHCCPLHQFNLLTHPRTNSQNFCEKILRIGGVEKLNFF